MFGSGEFLATAVTPSTYAARLYEAVLGRPPAGPEFERLRADVLEQMNSLLPGLVGSPEFAALQAGSGPTDYVVRLYEQALGRTPGPAEVAALTPEVSAGAYLFLARAFFGSGAYTGSPRTLATHVWIQYRAILGRDPSEAEAAAGIDVLRTRLQRVQDILVNQHEAPMTVRIQSQAASAAGPFLTEADVKAAALGAAGSVNLGTLVIAVVDRTGTPLAVFRRRAPPTRSPATSGNVDANDWPCPWPAPGPSSATTRRRCRRARCGSSAASTSRPASRTSRNAALYGIENTNRGCSLNTALDAAVPARPRPAGGACTGGAGNQGGCGIGIVTGKADIFDSDPAAVDPGGVPIFKDGRVAGGIGVTGVTRDAAEFAAFAGSVSAGGPRFGPRPCRCPAPSFSTASSCRSSTNTVAAGRRAAAAVDRRLLPRARSRARSRPGVPDGYLVGPTADSRWLLTAGQGGRHRQPARDAQAKRTRAAIRLPLGSATRMVIAVAGSRRHAAGASSACPTPPSSASTWRRPRRATSSTSAAAPRNPATCPASRPAPR